MQCSRPCAVREVARVRVAAGGAPPLRALVRQGPGNEPNRLRLLQEHEKRVRAQLASISDCLGMSTLGRSASCVGSVDVMVMVAVREYVRVVDHHAAAMRPTATTQPTKTISCWRFPCPVNGPLPRVLTQVMLGTLSVPDRCFRRAPPSILARPPRAFSLRKTPSRRTGRVPCTRRDVASRTRAAPAAIYRERLHPRSGRRRA